MDDRVCPEWLSNSLGTPVHSHSHQSQLGPGRRSHRRLGEWVSGVRVSNLAQDHA